MANTPSETSESAANAPWKMPRAVFILGLASLCNDIASEMVFPLLPVFILTELHGSRSALGLIEGLADSLASLLKLAAGHWSDRAAGRKRFVVGGYALTALLRPLLGLTTAVWQVAAIRLIDRFGKGLRTAPRDALIADATPEAWRGRAFGFHRAMDHAGAATGPLLAALFLWLWPGRLRELMWLAAIPGAVLVALVAWGLPAESASTTAATPPDKKPEPRPFEPRFRWFLVALVVFTLGNSSDAFLLVRANEVGVPSTWLPALWCVFHLVKSWGVWRVGHLSDRFGPRRMILLGWCWYAVVYGLFSQATAPWHAWALFLLYAGYYALTEPTEKAFVASLVGNGRRGLAFGWFNAAVGIATLPASFLFGKLYDQYGATIAFGFGSALALLAALLLAVAVPAPRDPCGQLAPRGEPAGTAGS